MPTTYKTLICLANSRKLSGRCIAGKVASGPEAGAWIRPVSERPTEEISEYDRSYEDGSDPLVLDLINVPFLEARPKSYQPENHLIDDSAYWRRAGQVTAQQLAPFVDSPALLWMTGHSTYAGMNDRVPLCDASALNDGSLYLLDIPEVTLHVFASGAAFGNHKRRVQGRFGYRGVQYHLWVTDPKVEREYLGRTNGYYELGRHYLTISLGEPKDGFCYKLIAAMISVA